MNFCKTINQRFNPQIIINGYGRKKLRFRVQGCPCGPYTDDVTDMGINILTMSDDQIIPRFNRWLIALTKTIPDSVIAGRYMV